MKDIEGILIFPLNFILFTIVCFSSLCLSLYFSPDKFYGICFTQLFVIWLNGNCTITFFFFDRHYFSISISSVQSGRDELSHLFFPLTEVILDFISPSSGHFVEVLFQACVELLSQPPGWMDNEMRVREGQRASRRPSGSPAKLAQWNVLNLILKRRMISLLIFFF